MSLGSGLTTTLTELANRLQIAQDPWWILGSAALALSGKEPGHVRDIDVLVSSADADRLMQAYDWPNQCDGGSARYRSRVFLCPQLGEIPVEIMAAYEIRQNGQWITVAPRSRRTALIGETALYVPGLEEQTSLLKALGRPKDLSRLARLDLN